MAIIEFFHPARIALDREIPKHPELVDLLQNHPVNEFEIRLAEVAAYCDILLDGDYTGADLDGICDACVKVLVAKRHPILSIVTESGGLDPKKLN